MIRTLVIEDERPARERLINQLASIKSIEVVSWADNGKEAVRQIDSYKPDLIFLDINLPLLNGFEVVAAASHLPEIIFVTAYDAYAIQAFELNAVDYLLKPFNKKRLEEAVTRAESKRAQSTMDERMKSLLDHMKMERAYISKLTVKDRYSYKVLDIKEVTLFCTESGLVYVYRDTDQYMINLTLKELEDTLDPDWFFRIRRNCIVNIEKIEEIISWEKGSLSLRMSNDQSYHVSRYATPAFKEKIMFN